MSVQGLDAVANRLAALGADARARAARSVSTEAEALVAEAGAAGVALAIEPGTSPLQQRIVLGGAAPRAVEFGTRQKPARPVLLRILTIGRIALARRLSDDLARLFGTIR